LCHCHVIRDSSKSSSVFDNIHIASQDSVLPQDSGQGRRPVFTFKTHRLLLLSSRILLGLNLCLFIGAWHNLIPSLPIVVFLSNGKFDWHISPEQTCCSLCFNHLNLTKLLPGDSSQVYDGRIRDEIVHKSLDIHFCVYFH